MICAVELSLMAHQWRRLICAVVKLRLVKPNGALGTPLGFSNGASMAQGQPGGAKKCSGSRQRRAARVKETE
jgi:hypothetical protein